MLVLWEAGTYQRPTPSIFKLSRNVEHIDLYLGFKCQSRAPFVWVIRGAKVWCLQLRTNILTQLQPTTMTKWKCDLHGSTAHNWDHLLAKEFWKLLFWERSIGHSNPGDIRFWDNFKTPYLHNSLGYKCKTVFERSIQAQQVSSRQLRHISYMNPPVQTSIY